MHSLYVDSCKQMQFRVYTLLMILLQILATTSANEKRRCLGGLCLPPELCRPVSVNVYDEVHLDFFSFDRSSSDECRRANRKCCPFNRIVREPETDAPDEKELVCAARNNNGVGNFVYPDKTKAKYGEFPWMSFVYTTEDDYEIYLCGGTLIQSKVVLTIAHCLEGKTPDQLRVRFGEWDLEDMIEIYPPQDRAVQKMIIHPHFYGELLQNDIAILFLDDHVWFTEVVGTVCLPPQNSNFDNKRCVFSGWGEDINGRNSSILKRTKLPIVTRTQCQKALRKQLNDRYFQLHEGFLCAGGESGKDACKGDGGSPLTCRIPNSENQYFLVGIVAFGAECGAQGVPGVYVNVPYYRDWIDGEIAKMYHKDIFVN
ncbi:phenoloxidase-activating factor 2-like isoform X1 [Uranotaenia lowii]|uniref:phenoloxidase-activating factor 2-like isoform X1 n=1 Tax=Uranotaenia lowii TaxID=190385 RepID=UPI002478891B|nr:phenoloxidase-activating factor 2-like isoform X1 [Uranotaenia lowii]XP_055610988.1 phenoloxidase-activating factor 2-like isoform X1 [Uranotaenia lowii]